MPVRFLKDRRVEIAIIVIFLLSFVTFKILFDAASKEEYFKEMLSALMGTILAAAVTMWLLRSQTAGEELKERNVAVFNERFSAYNEFLSRAVEAMEDQDLSTDEARQLRALAYKISMVGSDDTVKTVMLWLRSNFIDVEGSVLLKSLVEAFRGDLKLEGADPDELADLTVIEESLINHERREQAQLIQRQLIGLRERLRELCGSRLRDRLDDIEVFGPVGGIGEDEGFFIYLDSGATLMFSALDCADVEPIKIELDTSDVKWRVRRCLRDLALKNGFKHADGTASFVAELREGRKKAGVSLDQVSRFLLKIDQIS
jgi:hypothetical protein